MQRRPWPPSSRPLRVLIVDGHEISRAACSALLRTEGLAVADVTPSGRVVALTKALEPDVVLIDVGGDGQLQGTAQQLHTLAGGPSVVLTSSERPDGFDPLVRELPFLAKADICAEAILRAVTVVCDERPAEAESSDRHVHVHSHGTIPSSRADVSRS